VESVLIIWERNHPPLIEDGTPAVVFVTQEQSKTQMLTINPESSDVIAPTDSGVVISGTPLTTQELDLLAYKVKEGDTLGALATQFNSSVADIMTVNNLSDPDSLLIGQILYIPTSPLPTITRTPTPTVAASATMRPSATATRGPTATITKTQAGREPQVSIETVIGMGVLANEHLVLQRTGDGELSLAGWRLEDGAGNTYTFPQITLYRGGSINLNTRNGESTVLDLFWGLTSPVWKVGKTVRLFDAQNNLRTSYTIP